MQTMVATNENIFVVRTFNALLAVMIWLSLYSSFSLASSTKMQQVIPESKNSLLSNYGTDCGRLMSTHRVSIHIRALERGYHY